MSEPVPVQPVTLAYSGRDAALGPPIRHPGMELPTPPEALRRLVRQGTLGALYATSLIIALAALSNLAFPHNSHLRLARPALPLIGMFIVGAIANRLPRRDERSGWPTGLWVGGWLPLGLYGMYLMSTGYSDWVAALF
jgi:hypothetical protein